MVAGFAFIINYEFHWKRQSNYSPAPNYAKHRSLWGHTFRQIRELIQLKTDLPKKILSLYLGDHTTTCQWKWQQKKSSFKNQDLYCLNIIIKNHLGIILNFHFLGYSPYFHIDCIISSFIIPHLVTEINRLICLHGLRSQSNPDFPSWEPWPGHDLPVSTIFMSPLDTSDDFIPII